MDNINGIPVQWSTDDDRELLGRVFPRGVDSVSFENIKSKRNYRSPFMDTSNIPVGANLVTNEAISIFNYTGDSAEGDPGYVYHVETVPCDDGAKVYSAYQDRKPEQGKLYLFYERDLPGKSNLFGSFYIASMDDSFKGIIDNFLKDSNYSIPTSDSKIVIKNYSTLTQYVNSSALSSHKDILEFNTTYNAIEREYISKTPSGKVYSDLCSIDEMVAGGLNWCADKLDDFLLTEASYIPAENYSPVVKQTQPSGKHVRLEPKIPGSFTDSELAKDVNAALNSAYDYIAGALKKIGKAIMDHLPEPLKKVIQKMQQVVQWLSDGLATIIEGVQLFLGKFLEAVGEILTLLNAFLCGIINGIIGTVQGILRVLAFLVDMSGMDSDYQGYLNRRDVGEKVESVLDFISESFTSLMGAVKDLFTQSGDVTLNDITNFLQSIGGLLQKGEDAAIDFWNSTSRYKFAYWAGIFVFEVLINVLLLVITGGVGNAAKAGTYIEKFAAWAKLLGREAFSVATLGIVDILAFFKGLITAFVKACSKGLKGFFRWVEELIKGIKSGEAKNGEELLEDTEKAIFRQIAYSRGVRGEIPLSTIQQKEILDYAKLYEIDEKNIEFLDELSIRNTSYGVLFGHERLSINTDVMPGIRNTANSRLSWKAAIAHELEGHRVAHLVGKSFYDPDIPEKANLLLEEIQASTRASKHGIGLSEIERSDLLEDALERFNNHKDFLLGTPYENYTFEQLIEKLWIIKN